MPYPSLLYDLSLSDVVKITPNIPENVMRDLTLEDDFPEKYRFYLRFALKKEEIEKRQSTLASVIENPHSRELFAGLKEKIEGFTFILSDISRAESEEERVLFFAAAAGDYFDIVKTAAELDGLIPGSGFPSEFFRNLYNEPDFSGAARASEELRKSFTGKMSVDFGPFSANAKNPAELKRDVLDRLSTEMGLEDAIPPAAHKAKINKSLIKTFATLHNGYYTEARRFWESYNGQFLSGKYDFAEFRLYVDELGFIMKAAEYFLKLKNAGYPVVFPEISSDRHLDVKNLYDGSLLKRKLSAAEVVPNDLYMRSGGDNFFILTGANGGGKTTFLRSCATAVLFFMNGCPIAAQKAEMCLFDSIYTHFPSTESFENSGRFVDEAARADEIVASAGENSFAVFNETYSGTNEEKSEQYSRRLADTMYEKGVFGIFVTHIHSLTGGRIPTLAAVIDETDGNRRTYKIRRVGSTDSSFARDILKKYALDYDSLKARLENNKKTKAGEAGA